MHDKRVSRHLWEKHKIPKTLRRGLDRLITSLKLCDPRLESPRPNSSAPYPYLQISAGYCCHRCAYLTISSKLCQQHSCPSVESFYLLKQNLCDDVNEVFLQSWVKEGPRAYWIVHPELPSSTPLASDQEAPNPS